MKSIINIVLVILLTSVVYSCKDFEELEKNQNKPTNAPASLVLNSVLYDLSERPWSLEHRHNQFWCCNYNYYGTNEYWSSASLSFLTLKNVIKMEEEALALGASAVNPYAALGKFLRAYFYVRMTQRVGDLPLDDALQGLDNAAPTYNTQKEVFLQVLTWLDESNAELSQLIAANDFSLAGDFYYNNDLTQWQKVVNTFKLRVLIDLSKKETDVDLNIKTRFKTVIDNSTQFPIMTSTDDDMVYVYNGTSNLYPTNPGNRGFDKGRYNMSDTYLGMLAALGDPRTFVVANPAEQQIANGVDPTDFAAYVGAPSGESLDDMTFKAGNGDYSFINQKRYYTTFAGPEPGLQIGFAELSFNIAEAINRGWITGDAATYYYNGIRASMQFLGIQDGTTLEITEPDADEVIGTVVVSVSDYLAKPDVAYAGDNVTGLEQILTQKYLAFFQNSGQQAYFNYRRTGVPVFDVGPGTGNGGKIPKRWLYPVSEANNNTENYRSALQRQFGAEVDDLNMEIWINKD